MRMMRNIAVLCAVCLMLTALPLPAAAADDPVLTQVAAVKNDKFTVDAKKLGYTALNGECPERPVWYHMPEMGEDDYEFYGIPKGANDDDWWKAEWEEYIESGYYYGGETEYGTVEPAHYGISITDNGECLVEIAPVDSYDFIKTFFLVDRNGKILYQTALSYMDQLCSSYDEGVFSCGDTCQIQIQFNAPFNLGHDFAEYVNLKDNTHFSFPFGNPMYHGYATVLECLEKEKEHFTTDDLGYGKTIPFSVSLINDKGEKIITLSEPIQITTGVGGGRTGFDILGENYNIDMGGYSENLIWFTCDRQVGATLNELIENTDENKAEEVELENSGWIQVSNQYRFAEHTGGYADLQGNVVIPQKFDDASPFFEGIARVGIKTEDFSEWNPVYKYGFIDKTGNYIVEPKYYGEFLNPVTKTWESNIGTGCFSEGFAKVALKDESGALQFGYIDKTGAEVIPLQYEDAGDFQNGLAYVKKDGKWGYINTKGETVLPFEYAETYGSDGTFFVVGKEIDGKTKFGAVDADGNTILPFIFEDMSNPVNGLVYAFCNRELYSIEIAEIFDTGDLTGDGDVSIDDVQTALKAYTEQVAHKNPDLTAGQLKAADINGDGELTIEDVQYVLIYYTENKVAGKHMTWKDVMNR